MRIAKKLKEVLETSVEESERIETVDETTAVESRAMLTFSVRNTRLLLQSSIAR